MPSHREGWQCQTRITVVSVHQMFRKVHPRNRRKELIHDENDRHTHTSLRKAPKINVFIRKLCFYTLRLFPAFGVEPKQFGHFAIYSKAEFRCGANRKVSLQGGSRPRDRSGSRKGWSKCNPQLLKQKDPKDKKCQGSGRAERRRHTSAPEKTKYKQKKNYHLLSGKSQALSGGAAKLVSTESVRHLLTTQGRSTVGPG